MAKLGESLSWKGTLRSRLIGTAIIAAAVSVMFILNWAEQHSSFASLAQQRCYMLLWTLSAAGLAVGAWIDRPRTSRNLLLTGSVAFVLGAALGTAAWPDADVQIFTSLPLVLGAASVVWPDSPEWMRRRAAEEAAGENPVEQTDGPMHRESTPEASADSSGPGDRPRTEEGAGRRRTR